MKDFSAFLCWIDSIIVLKHYQCKWYRVSPNQFRHLSTSCLSRRVHPCPMETFSLCLFYNISSLHKKSHGPMISAGNQSKFWSPIKTSHFPCCYFIRFALLHDISIFEKMCFLIFTIVSLKFKFHYKHNESSFSGSIKITCIRYATVEKC